MRNLIALAGMVFCLSSCAVNQGIVLNYNPEAHEKIVSNKTISVNVSDERPFIKDKSKPSAFIGKFRGGYGNPWNAYTDGKVPLAQVFVQDLVKEVKALGLQMQESNADRTIKVEILDYNFDAYINGRFWYEIKISVLDQNNVVLDENTFKDEIEIKGSFWLGPMGAFKDKLPEVHQSILKRMIRENSQLIDTLR
ncbi:MAG: hypothetical protein HQL20_05120 [Candidatus Omnitrophica bacterium]|nr:hypothetical protein [Candidatus Omnitrophota bacterium]